MDLLQEDGMLDRLIKVASTPAPLDAILRAHAAYIERLQAITSRGGGHLDADTYVNADSYEAALRSAGSLINLVDAVVGRQAENGLALVRPPGHHALVHNGMGFCVFANVAVAARWAQRQHGIQRIDRGFRRAPRQWHPGYLYDDPRASLARTSTHTCSGRALPPKWEPRPGMGPSSTCLPPHVRRPRLS